MALSEQYLTDDVHPIDIVEHIAAHNEWEFDRLADDQIAMAVEGQWRTYSITLAWCSFDETLRMICTFEMDPPEARMDVLHEGLNMVNDQCWAGAFSYWADQKLMVYKYGLILAGGNDASPEQIDTMINAAVMSAERYYPAFQLMSWTEKTAHESMQIAIAEAYGRA
ncbi:type III secretion system chaperone family protein [Thalassococcus lentus]|uniref:YbjN domain-containing protein n=1 Tax=Thalassococcus lentus TaxID=1210524 RepID=A0ABT4XP56_9RHOB|nr:YbjN domain-containing protein [Thalassococcus lentus]MDA7423730.1 YbjN domain-containing protein [Thalassococcus lentus]